MPTAALPHVPPDELRPRRRGISEGSAIGTGAVTSKAADFPPSGPAHRHFQAARPVFGSLALTKQSIFSSIARSRVLVPPSPAEAANSAYKDCMADKAVRH